MSWRSDSSQLFAGKWTSSLYAGHGVQAQNIPATGDSGPSFLYNDIAEHGFAPTDEIRALIKSLPTNGVIKLNEDGTFEYTGADGVDYFTYELFGSGVSYDDYTVTLITGVTWQATINGGIPAVTASATATIITGTNSAVINGGIPAPSAAASASNSVPVFSAVVSGGIPNVIASVIASPSIGGNVATIIGCIPALSASVSAASTLPDYVATVSAGIPAVTALVVAINGELIINIPKSNLASVPALSRFVALPARTV